MSRRRKLLVLALVAALTAAYSLWRAPEWGARGLEHVLSRYFHRPVRIAALHVRPGTFEVEIEGLSVGGFDPTSPPFLEAPLVRVRPSLAPLRFGRLVLTRVRVEGLRLRIRAFPGPPAGPGGDDIPKLGGGKGGGLELAIERLVVVGGEFALNHQRVPLELDLPDFRGRFGSSRGGGLAGQLSFSPGLLRMPPAPELPVGTELAVRIERGVLTVESGRLLAENTDLAYSGRLHLIGRPQGQLKLDGSIDLAVLERHVFRSGLGLEGRARWDGLLSIDGSRLRIEGRMDGQAGRFMAQDVAHFATLLSYDGTSGLRLRQLALSALDGSGELGVEVPPSSTGRPLRVHGTMKDADGERLLRLIFGWGELHVGTAATGTVDVRWPRGRSRAISGSLGAELAERRDGRLPLAGRVDWRAENGRQTFERVELRGRVLHAVLSGEVAADERARLELAGETTDVAATDAALVQLRRALGNPEAQPTGLSGAGEFAGRWRGTLDWPVFEGRFTGHGIGYEGVDWGEADWRGTLDTAKERIDTESLLLRKGRQGELRFTGHSEIGWYGQKDALSGHLRVESWPVADLVAFMGWDVVASGLATGEARVGGRRSAPAGEARLTARDGRYAAVPYTLARLDSRWSAGGAEVTSGEVSLGGGRIRFRGTLTNDGVFDGTGEMEGVDLGSLLPAPAAGVAYGGRVQGTIVLQGTLTRPRLSATLRSPRLFFGDEGLGALEARLTGHGDGQIRVDGRCRSPRFDLALRGSVGAAAPYEAALTLAVTSSSLDPFVRVLSPALPQALSVIASGQATVRGPLLEPERLRAEASVPDLQLVLPDYVVRASEPVRLTLADGRAEVARLRLAGEGTDLQLAGGGDLLGSGPLGLSASGHADLRTLALVTRRLRGNGTARLRAELRGTAAAPRLEGLLQLEGAGLRVRGFPHGLEDLQGRVHFTERAAELQQVSGRLAGGRLTIEGEAAYAGGSLRSYDIRPSGRGLALRYPEGTRSLIDAQLRLFGDASKQWLTGTVDVRQALYTRRYDVASELLGARRALAPLASSSLDESTQLDLRLRAPGTLRVDNNLATLAARAELQLQGTARNPVLTGRAEIERGRLYFQGGTYHVQRGTLDFVNPQRLDPLFDIEAETRVRSYRVTLRVSGTLERVTPTLTSDPPLSSLQILALLAGQDESEVANLTQTQARQSQAQLAAAGAATLAAGRLSESVGLEREAERLFGLNRFSIDPSLLRGAGTTPTARVTVGKRLTPDLNVLYSQDLRGTEEKILALEYTLTDRFSLLLTRTDPGTARTGTEKGWAFDVRIRQSR